MDDNLIPEDTDFIEKVHSRFRESADHTEQWREEAEKCYAYVAGDQWDDDDAAAMEEDLKPMATFNRVEIFVNSVCGLEAMNRQEVQYTPRRPGPVQNEVNDLYTDAAEYVNDDCDAETHHSTAFKDTVIAGMGWTDTELDYESNPDGDIKIIRRNPFYCYWDPSASQRNLSDARWVMYLEPMSVEEVKDSWPEKADEIEFTRFFDPDYYQDAEGEHLADQAWKYENDQSRRTPKEGEEIFIVKYQWYEKTNYYRVKNPMSGETKDIEATEFNRLKKKYPEAMANIRAVGPIPKRQYKQARIAGWTVLEETDIPGDMFTLQCITGKYDQNENIWYGLVRNLIDPQDWINKLYSQLLHIINTNAKGGLIAEEDSVSNVAQFEDSWAREDGISWVKKGAIANGKIMPKQPLNYPTSMDRLMEYAGQMFFWLTGINMELLGMSDKNQPGVLEAQRKHAGMTTLSWAFDSMRAYRGRHGKVLATYIREFLADGRLIRISGPEGQQYIPLIRDKLTAEYDVIVSESPHSTNEKERTLAVLMQLLPAFAKLGMQPPQEMMEYLPLPQSLIESWKKQSKNPQQEQFNQIMQELAQMQKEAEVTKTKSEAAENMANAAYKEAQAQVEPIKAMS